MVVSQNTFLSVDIVRAFGSFGVHSSAKSLICLNRWGTRIPRSTREDLRRYAEKKQTVMAGKKYGLIHSKRFVLRVCKK